MSQREEGKTGVFAALDDPDELLDVLLNACEMPD
jgi:hypothetical protein